MRRADSRSKSRNARVVWDEANLEYLEASKSPKQKITEPKTPYHVSALEDGSISPIAGEDKFLDEAAQAEQIQHALMEVASTSSNHRRSRGGWTSSEDEADDMDQDTDVGMVSHKKSFREQRRAHYDEYRKLKALRQGTSEIIEDDLKTLEKEDNRVLKD
ncbi:hypothetical protein KP509_06G030700 [Ceratopteris richardii]|uniref:Protein phosphatase inhibitor 2 n=1 Tax=Ceratopteris richardii TaxID=49495 RepID=A0A8T2UMU8_CERRI|nr:hypothetical protein KP509_06G030700 [Ceratopteris richardii]